MQATVLKLNDKHKKTFFFEYVSPMGFKPATFNSESFKFRPYTIGPHNISKWQISQEIFYFKKKQIQNRLSLFTE